MSTVPMVKAHNRPFVDLAVRAGRRATGRFWVDTGGGGPIATESFAERIGVVAEGAPGDFAPVRVASVRMGDLELGVTELFIGVGMRRMPFGVEADGLLPGRALMRWRVTFDYLKRRLAVDEGGRPLRHAVDAPVHPESGFPRLEVTVGGETCGMLLDSGASHSMVSEDVLERWASRHPEWVVAAGAYGTANMGMGAIEARLRMIRVPEVSIGPFTATNVSFVARRAGEFEENISRGTTGAVVGAIGGNLLARCRITVDYPAGKASFAPATGVDASDGAMVPLVLADAAGMGTATCSVVGALDGAWLGQHAPKEGAFPGLLAVDGQDMTGLPLPAAISRLYGEAGTSKVFLLEGETSPFEVELPVVPILGGHGA